MNSPKVYDSNSLVLPTNVSWVKITGIVDKTLNPKWSYAPSIAITTIEKINPPKKPYVYY